MSILNVEHLSHGFGDRAIFHDVSFRLLKGEHIGLIGANGEGKSTFMNIITGRLQPDEGRVEWSKNVRAGYLDQHTALEKGMTIRQVLTSAFDFMLDMEQELNGIYEKMGEADEDTMQQLMEDAGTLQELLTAHDFYMIDSKVEKVGRALGLSEIGLDKDVSELSGGQRTKVLLGKLLLEKPDILLLDEPTNYLDVSHIDPAVLDNKLGGILEIYEKFVGDNPRKVPMRIAPSVHYSMGGLWVDVDQSTNVPGLFAAGECDYSQHGANRLGANSLLSAVYAGMAAGPTAAAWIRRSDTRATEGLYDQAVQAEQAAYEAIRAMDGPVNPYELYQQMADVMTRNVTVVRYNDKLAETLQTLETLAQDYERIGVDDKSTWNNTTTVFVRELKSMIDLAKVITAGALARDESRGSHYKPEFPERDDEAWLKTTLAAYDPALDGPRLSYEEVDLSLIEPRKRDNTTVHEVGKRRAPKEA